MTLFDIMPSFWLISAFCFFLFYLICNVDLSLCAVCSCLFSFAFSLINLPMYIQCFSFIGICFSVYGASVISRKRKRREKHIFCAVSRINSDGGLAKHHGQIFEVYSRDKYIHYNAGEIFTAKKSNGVYVLWSKNS